MMNFILIVLAIVVSNFITAAAGFYIMTRPGVLKWYTKYVMRVSEELVDDMYE